MKRGRELGGEVDSLDMANCLMLLSKVGETHYPPTELKGSKGAFKCKTCNRQFPSFQALGGHRASHKKPKLLMGAGLSYQFPSTKPKMHECHICGLGFGIGQALGGHMRKHRAAINHGLASHAAVAPVALGKSNSKGIDLHLDLNTTPLDIDLELDLRPPLVNCFI